MAESSLTRALFSLLDGDERLTEKNFQVCIIDGNDVAVKWKWHLRGVWSEVDGHLCWTPAGQLQHSLRVADVGEALRFTLEEVVRL